MARRVIVHLLDEDPVVAELERLPEPGDTSILVLDPRRQDGKPIHYLSDSATTVMFPMHRVSSIELFAEEMAVEEEVRIYREDEGISSR
jgi:hypothetical protein